MPIRVRRDDVPDGQSSGQADQQPLITVTEQAAMKGPSGPTVATEKAQPTGEVPSQTTWAVVSGKCTLTKRPYLLTFRKEGDTFALKSVERDESSTALEDMTGIEGPFDWTAFACPECGITWSKGGGKGPECPVIACSCRSLFCTARGVGRKKGRPDNEWWWRCPKCSIEAPVQIGLNALDGQAMKGK